MYIVARYLLIHMFIYFSVLCIYIYNICTNSNRQQLVFFGFTWKASVEDLVPCDGRRTLRPNVAW